MTRRIAYKLVLTKILIRARSIVYFLLKNVCKIAWSPYISGELLRVLEAQRTCHLIPIKMLSLMLNLAAVLLRIRSLVKNLYTPIDGFSMSTWTKEMSMAPIRFKLLTFNWIARELVHFVFYSMRKSRSNAFHLRFNVEMTFSLVV